MKKLIFSLSLFLSFSSLVHAQWTTSGANIYYTGGNVGIGTNNPQANLSFQNVSTDTGSSGITWLSSSPLNYGIYRTPGSWTAPNYQQMKLQWDAGILLNPGNQFGKSYVEIAGGGLRVTSGNIGIGTATPNGKLDIAALTASGQSDILQRYTWLGDLSNWGLRLEQQFNAPLSSIQYNWIMRKGTSTDIPVMSFAGGNVGINTTDNANWNLVNSTYKLAVNGSVIATSMTVKLNSAWPDYVFKKDYHLPSLQEVKAYIDQNQHLPEIPSEQQIAKDGLNLGEMNKLLMKKVEELTLYLIEQNKRIENQQKQIDKLIQSKNR